MKGCWHFFKKSGLFCKPKQDKAVENYIDELEQAQTFGEYTGEHSTQLDEKLVPLEETTFTVEKN